MPELGEVEIARKNLESWWTDAASTFHLIDAKVLKSGELNDLERQISQTPKAFKRRGKQLWVEFAESPHLAFHFRMTGQIVRTISPDERFSRIAWQVGDYWLHFADPRRFGYVEVWTDSERDAALAKLGPDPHAADPLAIREKAGARQLKAAILDQSVIAGVGNIAFIEVMWRLGLHPEIKGSQLSKAEWSRLIQAFVDFFDEVVERDFSPEQGRIDYVNTGGTNPFEIYQQDQCPKCSTGIERLVQGGRSTYFCPRCQRSGRR